jgi:hypothetical protein
VNRIDADGLEVEIERGEGWTDKEWGIVLSAIESIKKTKRGKQLWEKHKKKRKRIKIHKNKKNPVLSGGGSSTNNFKDGHSEIYFDTTDLQYGYETTGGRFVRATLGEILAHELGHALSDAGDTGPGNMDNVNQNENPIITELGMPPRVKYPLVKLRPRKK